jgi:hypothetical protein
MNVDWIIAVLLIAFYFCADTHLCLVDFNHPRHEIF